MITTITMTKNIIPLLLLSLFVVSCSSDDGVEERPPREHCGEIVRMYHSSSTVEEGNPCGDNDDYSRRYAFIVKNDITGNEKHFCINLSEFVDYKLGSIYCDKYTTDGW